MAAEGGFGEESWDESCEPQADALVLLRVLFPCCLAGTTELSCS